MKNEAKPNKTFQRLRVNMERGILDVVLSRPDVRNAFDVKTMRELTDVFLAAGRTGLYKDARLVLLSGEGKSFCAGADLEYMKSMASYSKEENRRDGDLLFRMFEAVRSCEVPVVVTVHGHAMGGALGLTACADIAFAQEGCQFRFSEVRLGIVPAVISPFVLAKMNSSWARRWMLTGESFDAAQAQSAGLVNFVGTAEEINRQREQAVSFILEAGPEAIKRTKKLLNAIAFESPEKVREAVVDVIVDVRTTAEAQDGLGAFLEKREPAWRSGKV